MNELGFIKYLIKLSNKYDSNIHKYFPNQELRNHYNKKLCKKQNINTDTLINIRINLMENNELIIKNI